MYAEQEHDYTLVGNTIMLNTFLSNILATRTTSYSGFERL